MSRKNTNYVRLYRVEGEQLLRSLSSDEWKLYSLLLIRALYESRVVPLAIGKKYGQKGEAFLGVESIAEACNFPEEHALSILDALEAKGILTCKVEGGGKWMRTILHNYEKIAEGIQGQSNEYSEDSGNENDPF